MTHDGPSPDDEIITAQRELESALREQGAEIVCMRNGRDLAGSTSRVAATIRSLNMERTSPDE